MNRILYLVACAIISALSPNASAEPLLFNLDCQQAGKSTKQHKPSYVLELSCQAKGKGDFTVSYAGRKISQGSVLNGRIHGTFEKFLYGKVSLQAEFRNGWRSGKSTQFQKNGKVRNTRHYQHGLRHDDEYQKGEKPAKRDTPITLSDPEQVLYKPVKNIALFRSVETAKACAKRKDGGPYFYVERRGTSPTLYEFSCKSEQLHGEVRVGEKGVVRVIYAYKGGQMRGYQFHNYAGIEESGSLKDYMRHGTTKFYRHGEFKAEREFNEGKPGENVKVYNKDLAASNKRLLKKVGKRREENQTLNTSIQDTPRRKAAKCKMQDMGWYLMAWVSVDPKKPSKFFEVDEYFQAMNLNNLMCHQHCYAFCKMQKTGPHLIKGHEDAYKACDKGDEAQCVKFLKLAKSKNSPEQRCLLFGGDQCAKAKDDFGYLAKIGCMTGHQTSCRRWRKTIAAFEQRAPIDDPKKCSQEPATARAAASLTKNKCYTLLDQAIGRYCGPTGSAEECKQLLHDKAHVPRSLRKLCNTSPTTAACIQLGLHEAARGEAAVGLNRCLRTAKRAQDQMLASHALRCAADLAKSEQERKQVMQGGLELCARFHPDQKAKCEQGIAKFFEGK